jgi:hypothetical protein
MQDQRLRGSFPTGETRPPGSEKQRPDVWGHAGANCETVKEEQALYTDNLISRQAVRLHAEHCLSWPMAIVVARLAYGGVVR